MKRLKLIGVVLLSVMLAEFSGATLRAEYHHVDDCSVCHYAGGAESTACGSCPNNLMIKCEVVTPNSGTKATVFGPYVWTEAPFNGVCEVCHTGTMYHQNNASGDHTHFNAENCTLCHKHSDEFAHGEGQACDTCHGHDGGAGTYQSHSTHTESDSDDLKGPNKTCDTCHDTNNYFRFADSATTLSATTVCDNCHSPGGVFDGVDDPEVGAKANWEDGVYEADGTTLKAGKEKWCATCHDDNPAYSRIQLPVIIIVDNPDGSFTGTWGVSSSIPGFYGTDYHYHSTGSGSDTFTWTPAINSSGIYEVFARWSEQPSRAPDATYTIYHDGGNTDVQVDQRSNGGKWVSLGFYTFDGVNDYVELVDCPNGYVVADAIKWIKETEAGAYAPQVIGDNATWGFYATGHGMRGIVDCLDCHVAKRKHIDHIQRSFQADETTRTAITDYSDSYRLPAHALKMPRPNPSMGVKYADFSLCLSCHSAAEILPGDGSLSHTNFRDEHHVSNGINGHAYHIARNEGLADSDWDQNYADSDATCVICHNIHGPPNAAMLRHGELISTDENDRRPALDFSYRKPQPYPRATATYTATSLPAGDYEVYAWWVKGDVGLRTTKARHTITHDGGSDEVLVNQNVHGGGGGVWYLLGTYPYTEGATGTVVIDNEFYDGGRYIIADAIRWQQITGGTYEVIVDNLDAVFTNDLSTWTAASHPEQWDSDYMFIEAHLPPTDPETTLTGSAGGYIAHNTKTCYTACHNTPIYESWFRTPVLWPKVIYHPG
ncbi:MAG: hypothetical protein SWE60_15505, partial [Thermodesulfobacteriota bacterium]|nr:hypothetical protein [Thermodesulfobacteriota bacterium]